VLTAEDLERLGGFARYRDVDGDGVGYRTLPGTNHPQGRLLHARQRPQREGQYTEREDDYVNNVDRLARKFEPCAGTCPGARDRVRRRGIGLICYGTSATPPEESRDQLRARARHRGQLLRLKAYPFNSPNWQEFMRQHERVYVVDQNRDAQLARADAPGTPRGADRQAAQRALLRRTAAGRPHRHRRNLRQEGL
jgi:2-oxoglutarate/2-oxoacid ferredoxin oxidoreductase subunit alpha